MQRGVTLIELLVVMGLMIVIGTIGYTSLTISRDKLNLSANTQTLYDYARSTHQRAVNQQDDSAWGIRAQGIAVGRDYYLVFRGSSFDVNNVTDIISMPVNVQFIDPPAGSSKDIIFSKLTGYPVGGATSFVLNSAADPSNTRTLSVSAFGLIELTTP